MPKRQATTAADFSRSERENVRILPDGTVELASTNLLGNPALLDIDADGNPVGWGTLVGVPEPTGWHVYDGRGRQNRATIPYAQDTYYQSEATRTGIPYPQFSLATDSETPGAPTVAVEDSTTLGLVTTSGWHAFALAWQSGETLTAPSSRQNLNLLAGDRVDFTDLPTLGEAPAGTTGLAFLSTDRQASSGDATTATLYVREVIPLSALSSSHTLSGPPTGDAAPTDETGVGGAGEYDALKWRIKPSIFTLQAGSYPVAWRFLTSSGWSAAQDSVTITVPETMQGRIEVRPPIKPDRAISWEPIWTEGGVQKTPLSAATNFRHYLPILGDSAATTLSSTDNTAIEVPDAPTVSLSTEDLPILTGTHKIRVTLDYGTNLESAASPSTSVTLASDETFSVERPAEEGGYATVLYDPVDRHADLTGIAHNQIQYKGPIGTEQGYRIANGAPQAVVSGGEDYTLSVYVKAEDISAASLFEVLFRDAAGEVLTDTEAVVTLSAGDHAWDRYVQDFTAPESAVFLEIYGHRVGEGTITVGALKIEEGASATAFDAEAATSGFVISVFETASSNQISFGTPEGFSAGGAVVTPDPDYTYTITYASSDEAPTEIAPASDWDYFADIDDVPFADYVAIKAEIEAL